ncbi:MAG: tyrosine-type recombinase/integrase [Clostridiales bacterium]|nr:tyrosine-type recombinase/integrase [Clostridiales bacterium]
MANITERTNKDGSVSYLIRAFESERPDGRQNVKSMTWKPSPGMTEKQIEKELNRQTVLFEEQVKAGTVRDGKIKFQSFAELWLSEYAKKQLKAKTYTEYEKQLSRVYDAIGHIKLKDIKTGHLNAFYSNLQEVGMRGNSIKASAKEVFLKHLKERQLSHKAMGKLAGVASNTVGAACKGESISFVSAEKIAKALNVKVHELFTVVKNLEPLSPSTVRSYHRLISSILTKAVKWGYITYNPAANAELPKMKNREAAHLDEEDARRLLELLQHEPIKFRAMITFDLLSGLRRGELLGLRWQDISFEDETITISQTSAYVKGKGTYTDTPKNKTSLRPLKLSRSAFITLREYKEWQDGQKETCGDYWKDKDGRVFTGEDGAPVHPDALTKWFTKFRKRYGFPRVTLHSLRHTYASIMIASGTPLVVVSKRLGHAQVSTTNNIYSHIIRSADEKAATVMDIFDDVIIANKPPSKIRGA